MQLTTGHLEKVFRVVEKPPRDPRWTLLTDADFEEVAERHLAEAGPGPLHVFAYGSLIWRPAVEPEARLRARARGWHRAFTLELKSWRGSPEQPGLMMALEHGGSCTGFVFRLPEARKAEDMRTLLRRETSYHEDLPFHRWIRLETEAGPVRALAFWAGPKGEGIRRGLPLPEVARVIARACGHVGSNAEYLYNTVLHLEEAGIRDRNLWELQALVAAEIEALHGPVGG